LNRNQAAYKCEPSHKIHTGEVFSTDKRTKHFELKLIKIASKIMKSTESTQF